MKRECSVNDWSARQQSPCMAHLGLWAEMFCLILTLGPLFGSAPGISEGGIRAQGHKHTSLCTGQTTLCVSLFLSPIIQILAKAQV
jgi:hypothetical protein